MNLSPFACEPPVAPRTLPAECARPDPRSGSLSNLAIRPAVARRPGLTSRACAAALGAVLACLTVVSAPALRAADSANPEEDRLRAALKEVTLQLRAAQSDLAGLQASQTALTEEKKVLAEKYETLKKQAAADRTLTDKRTTELQAEVTAQQAAIAKLNDALAKARAEGAQAAQTGQAAQAQNAKLTTALQALQRRIAELQAKNLALFLLGNEILGRYEDFSLGNALRAKEPFIGKSRTKLENLVQSYQDQLADQRAH